MEYNFTTPLKGKIALTDEFHRNIVLQKDNSLYKFIWMQEGEAVLEIDHVEMPLKANEIISLTPLHHLKVKEVQGKYLSLLFNSNFYCIYGHDNEVSCSGVLFNGTSTIMKLALPEGQRLALSEISDKLQGEYAIQDNLQEEMLRILLKRFIIVCTRLAREKFAAGKDKEKSFDIIRQYYVLVDQYFKEKKKVQDYAELLCRSPKTLSNLFFTYGLSSPLHIIHERTEAEAKRLLLYTSKSAKEIAEILGFEELAAFSRFFKNMTGVSISDFRKSEIRENLPTNPVE